MAKNFSLEGKNILVMGVANKRSIAWAIARALAAAGANLAFSYQDERFKDKVARLVQSEMSGALLLPCNVAEDEAIDRLAVLLEEKWETLHGIVHSIAYARKDELAGRYADTSREGFHLAHDISVYSFVAVARRLSKLMKDGGSIITLTFQGSERVVPITTSWEWPRPLWKLPSATWLTTLGLKASGLTPSPPAPSAPPPRKSRRF